MPALFHCGIQLRDLIIIEAPECLFSRQAAHALGYLNCGRPKLAPVVSCVWMSGGWLAFASTELCRCHSASRIYLGIALWLEVSNQLFGLLCRAFIQDGCQFVFMRICASL